MRCLLSSITAATIALSAALPAAAQDSIIQGPVFNPANNARYYRAQVQTWLSARTFARALGGDLATINDAAEDAFVRTNVGVFAYLGLTDQFSQNVFQWTDGSASTYRNWGPNQPPDNTILNFAYADSTGRWVVGGNASLFHAIIEITGPLRVPQEFPTVAAALAAANAAGTREILLAPGVYTLSSPLPAGDFVIRGSGRSATRLDIAAGLTVGAATLSLESLTVASASNAGITLSSGSTLNILDCSFDLPALAPASAAISALAAGAQNITIDNSDIRIVGALVAGSAAATPNVTLTLRNTLVVAPQLTRGAAVRAAATSTTLVGTSSAVPFFGSTPAEVAIANTILSLPPNSPAQAISASYSLLPYFRFGPDNFVVDGGFVNPAAGDYRLRSNSFAINRGNNAALSSARPRLTADSALNARVVGGASDIGAFERQTTNTLCPADFNNDAVVDINDFFAYLTAYANGCP